MTKPSIQLVEKQVEELVPGDVVRLTFSERFFEVRTVDRFGSGHFRINRDQPGDCYLSHHQRVMVQIPVDGS